MTPLVALQRHTTYRVAVTPPPPGAQNVNPPSPCTVCIRRSLLYRANCFVELVLLVVHFQHKNSTHSTLLKTKTLNIITSSSDGLMFDSCSRDGGDVLKLGDWEIPARCFFYLVCGELCRRGIPVSSSIRQVPSRCIYTTNSNNYYYDPIYIASCAEL